MALHLVSGPLICPQQASKIKSSLYIIHWRRQHVHADRAGVSVMGGGTEEGGDGEKERESLTRLCIKGRTARA